MIKSDAEATFNENKRFVLLVGSGAAYEWQLPPSATLLRPDRCATLQLPERAYSMDIRYPLMAVATADRKLVVVNLTNPQTIYNTIQSPLKYQSRCVACFPDQQGFCLGSIEGRVAVHHVHDRDTQKNFAFKCHRENNDIYAVNCIAFHPTFGTFATTGSDGTFNFWDKEARQRAARKKLEKMVRANPVPKAPEPAGGPMEEARPSC